jgi:nitroimidazol reductase NimA-like FMN-containing flavoprotein (pyridoxamine 5'-phosphate oxidase superfamily)
MSSTDLQVLDTTRCLDLLSGHHFGRLAVSDSFGPLIFPVNYVFTEPSILVRTAVGTKLESSNMQYVGFEIDDADRHGAWGWSVLVQGPAFEITGALDETSEHLRKFTVTPWAPGERDHWLKITARNVSGRCFGTVPGW